MTQTSKLARVGTLLLVPIVQIPLGKLILGHVKTKLPKDSSVFAGVETADIFYEWHTEANFFCWLEL